MLGRRLNCHGGEQSLPETDFNCVNHFWIRILVSSSSSGMGFRGPPPLLLLLSFSEDNMSQAADKEIHGKDSHSLLPGGEIGHL